MSKKDTARRRNVQAGINLLYVHNSIELLETYVTMPDAVIGIGDVRTLHEMIERLKIVEERASKRYMCRMGLGVKIE